jgi:hypothetical protein
MMKILQKVERRLTRQQLARLPIPEKTSKVYPTLQAPDGQGFPCPSSHYGV